MKVFARLDEDARKALLDRADREWREPADEAGKIITDALIAAGDLRYPGGDPRYPDLGDATDDVP